MGENLFEVFGDVCGSRIVMTWVLRVNRQWEGLDSAISRHDE